MIHSIVLRRALASIFAVVIVLAAGCGGSDEPAPAGSDAGGPPAVEDTSSDADLAADELAERSGPTLIRVGEMQQAIAAWANAETIEEAHASAERAANLVVGLNGPRFGDRDGDGTIEGSESEGLLSGRDGTPPGLAADLVDNVCVERDVLGAAAEDVNAGWDEMLDAIDAWTPSNNTMPSLASHPMRIVGWATFTLASDDLDEAHEYASHAELHVEVTSEAVICG